MLLFLFSINREAVVRRCSVEKVFLEISQNAKGKHLCQGLVFNKVAGLEALRFLLKKKTLPQVFSCEFYEISKNIFFHRTTAVAASDLLLRSNEFELVQVLQATYRRTYEFFMR